MRSKFYSSCFTFLFTLTVASHFTSTVNAHEYWVEPTKFKIKEGAAITANLRNGQDFKGPSFPYIKEETNLYKVTNSTQSVTPNQRTGNSPAFNYTTTSDGLHLVSFQNDFNTLNFETWPKFTHYVENQGFTGLIEKHLARGLEKIGFQEQYARCAKALIQVGDIVKGTKQNTDKLTGLKFELVANKNPYTLKEGDKLPVTLFYEGSPVADKQIQVFHDDGTNKATNFKLRTDKNGNADITLNGSGKFMLNAVYIYAGDEDPNTEIAEYQSYWTSLVFGIKGTDALLSAQ